MVRAVDRESNHLGSNPSDFESVFFSTERFSNSLTGYIPLPGSKNQKNLYCLFLKNILLTMFLQNFIEMGPLEPTIRPFIARNFWNYLMST